MKTPPAEQYVDGFSTSHDWQRHVGGVAVLPIGSFEQHGGHLPVATDNIQVEFFARHLARQIGAALLPTLTIFQCYEHTGFRGSFALRPETAMRVVRDLVDELARQTFTRLVVLNGHGGNFALPTLVRDINRLDGPVKLLLVDAAGQCDPALCNFIDDLHSGAWETSLFMAVAEEMNLTTGDDRPLVGELETTGEPEIAIPAALRTDLNHFGLGVLRPRGPWGDQRGADLAFGRKIVASIKGRLVEHVRTRLAWFDEHPTYGGPGTVLLRAMTEQDIPRAMELVDQAGWNQTPRDWRTFLACAPEGCVAAVHNGRLVATATAVAYGTKVGWIGMVLVDAAMRRRGIATRLMNHAVELLADCESVKLDATPAGRTVYEKLGFRDEYTLARMICENAAEVGPVELPGLRAMTEADLPTVIAMDAETFGAPRDRLIRATYDRTPAMCFVREIDGRITAAALGRIGSRAAYVGPMIAADNETAFALAASVIAAAGCHSACIDVNDRHKDFLTELETLGFAFQRPLVRMARGENRHPGRPENQYAIASPALG